MSGGPRGSSYGFAHAVVTKTIFFATGLSSLAVHLFKIAPVSYHWTLQSLTTFRFHRIILQHLPFTSPAEVFLGLIAIYWLRVVERQRGSRRYAAFVSVAAILGTVLQTVSLLVIAAATSKEKKPFLEYFSSGPYSIIFAGLVLYAKDIPPTLRFKIAGVTLTDKAMPYLLWLQLSLSGFPRSLWTALIGATVGVFYAADIARISRLRYPERVISLMNRSYVPLVASQREMVRSAEPIAAPREEARVLNAPRDMPVPVQRPAPVQQQNIPQNNNRGGGNDSGSEGSNRAPAYVVNEDDVTTLIEMGFDREEAVQALTRFRNVEGAANFLLNSYN